MKKLTVIALFVAIAGSAGAVEIAVGPLFSYEYIEQGGEEQINFDSLSDLSFLSLVIDAPLGPQLAMRIQPSVKFEEIPEAEQATDYPNNIHWDGTIGVAYHLFGRRAFLDPYLEGGLGSAGATFFDDRRITGDARNDVALQVFMYVAGGLNLVFNNQFVIGARVRVMPQDFNPSPLISYEQFPIGASASIGIRI